MTVVELLAALEEAEARLSKLEEERRTIAARADGDPTLDGLLSDLAAAEAALRSHSSTLRQLELEVGEIRERAGSHERAIYDGSVRNPAGLERRQHELTTLRSQIAHLEDLELEQMSLVEEDEAEITRLRRASEDRRSELVRVRGEDSNRLGTLAVEQAAAAAATQQALAQIPEATLRLYRRIAARRQPAVARVAGGACGGCRLPLPHRILEEVRRGQVVTCENCERILLL